MKIKLFSSSYKDCTQEEVNLWLQQYEDTIRIEKIEYSCCTSIGVIYHNVMVVFSETPKNEIK